MSDVHGKIPLPAADAVSADDRRAGNWKQHLPFLLIVVAAVALRLICFGGYQGRDDRNYSSYAYSYATRGTVPLDDSTTWLGRIGFWIPQALALKAFGLSEASLSVYPMLCSIGNLFVIYAIANRLLNRRIALISTGLLGVFPLDVIFATFPYTDLPVSFYTGLMLLFFVRAESNNAWYDWLGIGLCAGIAYLHKETSLAYAVPLGVYVAMRRLWRPGLAYVVVGGLLMVCCEFGFWYATTGDPLQRFHLAAEHQSRHESRIAEYTSWVPRPAKIHRHENFFLEPFLMFSTEQEFAIFYWLVWPAVLFLWWKKDDPTRLFRVILVVLGGMLCYFPFNFPHVTLGRDPRHFTILTVPALILLSSMVRYLTRRQAAWALTGLVATSLACIAIDGSRLAMANERQLLVYQKDHPQEQFWVDAHLGVSLFVVSDFLDDPRIGVLERAEMAGSHANSNLQMLRPGVKMAKAVDAVTEGTIVTREGKDEGREVFQQLTDAGWKKSDRIAVERASTSCMLRMFPQGERFIRRLSPSSGGGLQLWQKSAP